VVLGEINTPETFQRTYILRPAVNPAALSAVMILTPQRGTAGVANVWADVGAVDAVTRGIVLAGDSLARQAAAAEGAARRQAIDSAARILRDSLGRDTTRVDSAAAAAAPVDPAVAAARARARRDSAAARARRDSIRRAQADTPTATTTPPVTPR
jgi:hypothetical protein